MVTNGPRRSALYKILFITSLATSSFSVYAETFYVSPDGSNTHTGSLESPWQSIQYGADQLTAGDTLFVRSGTYAEAVTINVSGNASDGYINIRNFPNEEPVIDGASLTVPDDDSGLFLITDQSYINIDGFELKNYASSINWRTPIGIFVTGHAHHIQLRNNKIHDIASTAHRNRSNAHGIAVYGTSSSQSINNIVIEGNELYDLTLGWSESLVLNGNVEQFSVSHNHIHDNNNIGIDFIGYEGTASDPNVDRARNGIATGNVVYNIYSQSNPAYGGGKGADGIYVDGGTDIIIEKNRVYQTNIGIEVASEHAGRSTDNIIVRNNIIYHTDVTGIAMGGYRSGLGSTESCSIINNTLFQNDVDKDGNGEIMLQYNVHNNSILNNIIVSNNQNLLISNISAGNSNNTVDYNLYHSETSAANSNWHWNNVWYTGLSPYMSATGNDSHSLFSDPLFVNSTTPNLHIQDDSPAINAALTTDSSGSQDFDGHDRTLNGATDIGADEVLLDREYQFLLASQQWQQIGIPCNPGSNNTVEAILADDLGSDDYGMTWVIFEYNTATNRYTNLGLQGTLTPGTAYWLTQNTGHDVTLDVPGSCTRSAANISTQCHNGGLCNEQPIATTDHAVQWNMRANPFNQALIWNTSKITTLTSPCDTSAGCTLDSAESLGVFHNQVWAYNAANESYDVVEGSDAISPWQGFWSASLNSAHNKHPRLLMPLD